MKKCLYCKKEIPRRKGSAGQQRIYCDKSCLYAFKRENKIFDYESFKRKFSNPERIDELLKIDSCQICGRTREENVVVYKKRKNLVFDHDHKTNKLRGVLCDSCNRALGLFQDSLNVLEKAVNYLRNS